MFVHIKRRPAVWLVMSLLLMLTIALVPPPAYAAGSFTVNTTTDGHDATPGNGVCETVTGNGVCTLRAAIEEGNALGFSTFVAFSVNGTFTLSLGELHVTGSPKQLLTITGNGQTMTIVDANKASRVLEIDSGSGVTISGVTLQHGSVAGDGGGIRNSGSLMLTNSLVSSNAATGAGPSAVLGGGIANKDSGNAILNTVTIDSNTATATGTLGGALGGGIETTGFLSFDNGTISNNMAQPVTGGGEGGGIGIDGGVQIVTLTNLDIHDNSASEGGGMESSSVGTTYTNVTLHANHAKGTVGAGRPTFAGDGGGYVDFAFGKDTFTNVTVDGNTATGSGGGIADHSGAQLGMKLGNVTIANNTAGGVGGGLFSAVGPDSLSYTILSANTPTNCGTASTGTIASGGQNIENGSSCGFVAGADKPNTDPLLIALANNPGPNAFVPPTDALPANSPAVDFSPAGTCPPPATDERGVTRPQGAACDSGAYELIQGGGPPPPPKCDKDGDGAVKVDRHHRRHCRDKDND
jgi:CSLREA domain-containing protein